MNFTFPAPVAMAIDWTEVTTVVIAGIVIVLGVLALLILVFYIFGAIMKSVNKSGDKKKAKAAAEKQAEMKAAAEEIDAKPAKMADAASGVAEENEARADEEVAAVIAAAVAAYEGDGAKITSIKKKQTKKTRKETSGRNAWSYAAVTENTKPF